MNMTSDHDLERLIDVWRSGAEPQASPEAIYRHVRRRRLLLKIWIAVEAIIATAAFVFLAVTFASSANPVDRGAMATLGVIVAAALAVSWRTWRGVLRTPALSAAACLALARERARRFRRACVAGWGVLTAELAVFIPWIAYRFDAGLSSAEAQRSAWGLLAAVTALAVGFLLTIGWWARREERTLERIARDLDLD